MILLLAVAAGWLFGLVRSWITGKRYSPPGLEKGWLVLAAVFPQLLVFHIPQTAVWFSDRWAAPVLVGSQLILLLFIWYNRHLAGIKLAGLGLILNLLVIAVNGGLMPLAPETAQALYPNLPEAVWQIGTRPGRSKNIILPSGDTALVWLSDFILLPAWFPWSRAVSPGDLALALGVFWILAVDRQDNQEQTSNPLPSKEAI